MVLPFEARLLLQKRVAPRVIAINLRLGHFGLNMGQPRLGLRNLPFNLPDKFFQALLLTLLFPRKLARGVLFCPVLARGRLRFLLFRRLAF